MPLLINGILLIFFWLLAVFSVSIYESFTLSLCRVAATAANCLARFPEPTNYFYFFQQLKALAIAIVAVIVVRKFPIRVLKTHKFASVAMIAAFILQLLVFTQLGETYGGARGWISLPGLGNLQPSEFFKLAYVFFLSSRLLRRKEIINSSEFLIQFIVTSAALYWIFLFIPDLGTVLIIGVTALVIARYAGLRLRKILLVLGIGVTSWFIVGMSLYMINPKFDYIHNRFSYFLGINQNDQVNQDEQIGRQNEQALRAIGGGGFLGEGYGKGLQKFWYIPEAQSDFIFAAFSEEIGFAGNLILLGLYCRMFRYVLSHLQKLRDPQSKMIGVGIISIITIQTFIHICVNIKILPNTGITLPFVSAWGTSLMVSCMELMLLYKLINSEAPQKLITNEHSETPATKKHSYRKTLPIR